MGMRWQDWMNILLGIWLLIAPLLMAYAGGYGGVSAWNSYLVGLGLVVVPLLGLIKPMPRREWLVLALAIWAIVAPFALGFANEAAATWNTVLTGVVVAIAAAAAIGARGKGRVGA
jgi:hypothetical protein